jgi:hypothetical protein
MATFTASERRRRPPLDPLLAIVALILLAVAGIAGLGLTETGWGLALALAVAAAATVALGLALRDVLADEDGSAASTRARRGAAVLAIACAVAVVVAAAVDRDEASTRTAAAPDAAGAARTVRDFLDTAIVEDNAYAACQYLTPPEQQRVGELAGQGQTCRDALIGSQPTLAGVTSDGSVQGLRLRTAVHGRAAVVTVSGAGARRLTFALQRATLAEQGTFQAPKADWRIASGATALLGAPPPAH